MVSAFGVYRTVPSSSARAAPFAGAWVIVTVLVSIVSLPSASLSLARTSMTTKRPSSTSAVSSIATGAMFGGAIKVSVTVAVSDAPAASVMV